MRMSHCPMCGGGNVNNLKVHNKWYSRCYNKECCFQTPIGMPTRKLSRYNWNLLHESITGEELPDDACGRQERAFMKKEIAAGAPTLVKCFTHEDLEKWEETHNYNDFNWLVEKGKKRRRGKKIVFSQGA